MELISLYGTTLLTLASLHIVAAIAPGPSVILVAHSAAFNSRRSGLIAALAMGVGASLWALLAIYGLDFIFTGHPDIFHFFQVLGSGFLIWTGFKMFLSSKIPLNYEQNSQQKKIFVRALKLQLSNPKVVVFFSSIFLAALPSNPPAFLKIIILIIIFLNETLWYSFLAFMLSTSTAQEHFGRWKTTISSFCGIFLGLIGIKLFIGTFL